MRPLASQIVSAAAVYALVGPALGTLFVHIYLSWPFAQPVGEYFSAGMLLIGFVSVFVGYAAGIVPAAFAGAAYAYTVSRLARRDSSTLLIAVPISGAIGFLATLIPLSIYFGLSFEVVSGLLGPSAIGALSSVICALSLHIVGALPTHSFKPNPLRGSA